MSFELVGKLLSLAGKITATTALTIIAIYLVFVTTDAIPNAVAAATIQATEATKAAVAAKETAEEAKEIMSAHIKMTSESQSIQIMLLIQICMNGASTVEAARICGNYR